MRVSLFVALLAAVTLPAPALANNLGCSIVLCMANPDGPRALRECKPPMDELERRLRQGKSPPKCNRVKSTSSEQEGDYVVLRVDGQEPRYFGWDKGGQLAPVEHDTERQADTLEQQR